MYQRHPNNSNLKLHTGSTRKGSPVQHQYGSLVENYLQKIDDTLHNAINEHARTLAIRIDLRLPLSGVGQRGNLISRFVASLKAQIKADLAKRARERRRAYHCNPRFIWAREQKSSEHYHFHLLILLNRDTYPCLGSFNAQKGGMSAMIKKSWSSALGLGSQHTKGLVHFPNNAQYIVDSNSLDFEKQWSELFYRVSYLAKSNTKNYGDSKNNFGCSRK